MSDETQTATEKAEEVVPCPSGWTPEQMSCIPSALRDPVERLIRYGNENGTRPRYVKVGTGRREFVTIAVLDEQGARSLVNEQLVDRLQPGAFGLNAAVDHEDSTLTLSLPSEPESLSPAEASTSDEPRSKRKRGGEG